MSNRTAHRDRAAAGSVVLDLIGRGWDVELSDEEFGGAALRVFEWQYEHNQPFRTAH